MPPEATIRFRVTAVPARAEGVAIFVAHRESRPWRAALQKQARVGTDGRGEIRGLPPGKHRITLYPMRRKAGNLRFGELLGALPIELRTGEVREIDLDLAEFTNRFGEVTATVSGALDPAKVLAGIHSLADPEERWTFTSERLDDQGRLHFSGLLPGDYVVTVSEYSEPRVERKVQVTVKGAETVEINVQMR